MDSSYKEWALREGGYYTIICEVAANQREVGVEMDSIREVQLRCPCTEKRGEVLGMHGGSWFWVGA